MLQFILTDILMISLGIMLYLVARSLPRLEEESSETKTGLLDRWIASGIPEKIDAIFNNFLIKTLRKTKVVLLKVDNFLTERLKKIAPNGNDKPKIDFKEINGENKTTEVGTVDPPHN